LYTRRENLWFAVVKSPNTTSLTPVGPRHFLIPWTGGAFAPLGPLPCPTTEEKKWPIAPKPGSYDLYCVNEFNIEKKFKK
jgi:hypothetical protein